MIFKQLNRLQQIDQLIRQKRTGNAKEFARKLGLSRRQVYYILEELKSMGLDIVYDRYIESYLYLRPYHFIVSFKVKELTYDELRNTDAGAYPFFSKKNCCMQFDCTNLN